MSYKPSNKFVPRQTKRDVGDYQNIISLSKNSKGSYCSNAGSNLELKSSVPSQMTIKPVGILKLQDEKPTMLWLEKVRVTVEKILMLLAENQIILKKNLNKILHDYDDIWTDAFTHETYSASKNYEELEYLGDAVLKYVFPKYLMATFEGIRKDELTNLNTYFMSRDHQAKMSQKLGLPSLLRIYGYEHGYDGSIPAINGDLFESFFGAISKILDDIINGYGAIICYNMIIILYNNELDDIEEQITKYIPEKTQINQIFERLNVGRPICEHYDSGDMKNAEIVLNNTQVNYLKNHNIAIKSGDKSVKTPDEISQKLLQRYADGFAAEIIGKLNITKSDIIVESSANQINIVLNDNAISSLIATDKGVGVVIGLGTNSLKIEAEKNSYQKALTYLNSLGVTTEWSEELKREENLKNVDANIRNQAISKYRSQGYKYIDFFIPAKLIIENYKTVELIGVNDNDERVVLVVAKVLKSAPMPGIYTDLLKEYIKN